MAISNSLPLIYMLLLSLTTTLLTFPFTTNTKPQKLVTQLIHRDSIISPFYNPKHSIKDRANRILKNSKARFEYLQAKAKRKLAVEEAVDTMYQADVLGYAHLFLVNLSIGEPPVSLLVVMDTASTLTWVQCKQCTTCFVQNGPLYDSSVSSTYIDLSCHNPVCRNILVLTNCDEDDNCIYEQSYGDGVSHSKGSIGNELLTFQTADDGIAHIFVVFGCGHENKINNIEDAYSGILGLGHSESSIVNATGLRFSYCIGNIHDSSYNFNTLTLGDGVMTEGDSTPFETKNGFYYVTLEGISVGEERLDIDPNVFKKNWRGDGGTIIDSGCEFTYLPRFAYNVLKAKVSSIIDGFLKPHYDGSGRLCYHGKLREELVGFPVVTLHFAQGADLVLDIGSSFFQSDGNVFCIALDPIRPNDQESIIGVLAQQYYNVVYDLGEKKIYFQRIDCEVLL